MSSRAALPAGQGRASNPSPNPASEIGTPMPSSGVWKMMNMACLPVAQLLDQRIVHQHFRDAAVRQAADEAGGAHVGVVDSEPETARQQNAERRQHAQDARLLVRRLHHDDGKPDILPVLRGDELHDHALLSRRPGRRVAAKIPVPMFRLHLALRESLSRQQEEQCEEQDSKRCTMMPPDEGRPFCDEMPVKGPRSPSRAAQRVKKEAENRDRTG